MIRKTIKYSIVAIVLITIILLITFIVVASRPTGYPSAYNACRDVAMHTKGWDVWVHQREEQEGSHTTVFFTDGVNTLACPAAQIESLWYADAEHSFQTMSGPVCPDNNECPWEWDYHAVSP